MSIIPPLRIALTTCDDIFDAGGVSTSITRIARGLSTQYNAQVDLLMLHSNQHAEFNPHGSNGIIKLDQRLDNVTVYKLTSWTGGSSAAQHWVDIHYALLELAKERRYDLMQAFYASITGFPTVYAARELNIPSIVSIRGNDIIRDAFKSERFPYLKWALEYATQFTAVSQEGLQRARILSACPTKGSVILNSIRPEDYSEGTQEFDVPHPIIGSLAVFKNKKGIEVLLCAFSMLLQQYPLAHLLLVGFVIPGEQNSFETLKTKYTLNHKVTVTGRIQRHDALRYIRSMDIFAFTSLHDGCPNTVLEAMLAGVPIIATRAGAVPQLIENGKHGLLVQPGSATELCEAMIKMLEDNTNRQEYGNQAQQRVLSEFAPHKELEAYWKIYQECRKSQ
ncbi:MAG TPA: glycosyltransferase [Ktedonobacteraceae bacterium]|nr:glycosyltransferase [Ktedonobacteraceae bacterium]